MRKRLLLATGLAALLVHYLAAVAGGEESGARHVRGEVKDALGRPVSGATLTLRDESGALVATGRSGDAGEFDFPNVSPGRYTVTVDKEGFKPGNAVAYLAPGKESHLALSLEATEALTLPVIEKRLDVARNRLSPSTGGSVYHFSDDSIKALPQGQNTQFNQVILQAPGVAQDSFGQLHVRGDHANIQYRIDGIQIPEGITTFSQAQSPRFARSIDLLTGALPAQYGFRTAAVIDIKTRTGAFENGGSVEMFGGQRDTIQPSFDIGGTRGNLSFFMTGQFLHNNRGIDPPTSEPDPVHDETNQGNFFAYLSYVLNPTTRVAFISGSTVADFQIPSKPNQMPAFTLVGVNDVDPNALPSIAVKESQLEQTYYNVLALQGTVSDVTYQIAPFSRYSKLVFHPDQQGDLIYTGIASRILRSDFVNGVQGDASYPISETHTLRAGFYVSGESVEIDDHAAVFPADPTGAQTSNTPLGIVDDLSKIAWLYDVYVQDEWKPFERVTINFGLRYDVSDQFTHASEVSPRVGIVYKLFDATTLHAAYARYFTPPPTELVSGRSIGRFTDTTNAAPVTEASPVKPDRSHYFDAGIIQQVIPGLTVGLDGYYKMSRDLLDEGQFGSAIVFSPFNYKKGFVGGTEVTANYNTGNLVVYVNYAFSVAKGTEIESGQFLLSPDDVAFSQNHYIHLDHDQLITGSFGALYRWEKTLFSVDAIHGQGLRNGDHNSGHVAPYIQFDGAISRTIEIPGFIPFELRVAGVNLFDRTYQIRSGSGIGVAAAQFGPRRAVFGGIRIPFSFGSSS